MPKLGKYKKNEENEAILETISGPHQQELIISTVKAIEGFVQLSVIALGLLQMAGLLFHKEINRNSARFMRTVSNTIPSERTVADYLRKNIYMLYCFFPDIQLTSFIREHQVPCDYSLDELDSLTA